MTQGDVTDLAPILQGFNNIFINLRMDLMAVLSPGAAIDRTAMVQKALWSHFNRAIQGDEFGQEADLTGADLVGEDLSLDRLRQAYYDGADIGIVRSEGVTAAQRRYVIGLNSAILAEADLQKASFERTSLFSADLSDANLADANLSGAKLTYASLDGANLTGADLSDANLKGADLSDVSGLSKEQLETASVDDLTCLPDYL